MSALATRRGAASTTPKLSLVYKEARKYDQAIALYEQVVSLREVKLGPEHNDTIRGRHNVAKANRASGNEAKAIEIQNEILDLLDAAGSKDA